MNETAAWEYLIRTLLSFPTREELNALGHEGWELVSLVNHQLGEGEDVVYSQQSPDWQAIFKRPLR